MHKSGFIQKLRKKWLNKKFVCVGLDSQYDRIPEIIRKNVTVEAAIEKFNQAIIDATHDLVCAYKPNIAFYESRGIEGLAALMATINYIHEKYSDIPIILDAKRADIGNTNQEYVKAIFENVKVDAVTIQPYLGKEAVEPFLALKDKGIIILCRTSNPGAGEFQDLIINHPSLGKVPLYQVIAHQVAHEWNKNGNCSLVVGATYPKEIAMIRTIAPNLPFLIPGIGEQGGNVKEVVTAGQDKMGGGLIINASRSIIFASGRKDFAMVAREKTAKLSREINQYL